MVTESDKAFYRFIFFIIAACLAARFFLCPVRVQGDSMYPTYHDGQFLMTERLNGKEDIIERGDVVVIKSSSTGGKYFIKRCVGIPGDTIDIKEGKLYVNGEEEKEGFPAMKDAGDLSYPMVLEEGKYFLLGDNRNNSMDSRSIGPVPAGDIKFRVKDNKRKV